MPAIPIVKTFSGVKRALKNTFLDIPKRQSEKIRGEGRERTRAPGINASL